MIIVQLQGGLGNQMFQYAAARALADRLNKFLYLDISAFDYDRQRDYNLACFPNIADPVMSNKVHDKLVHVKSYLKRLQGDNGEVTHSSYNEEPDKFNRYVDIVNHNKDIVFLTGYFQSEQYFSCISEKIKEKFILNLPGKFGKLSQEMQKSESVAVHVRRGDYVTNPNAAKMYKHCTMEYYQRAINYIANNTTKELKLFIFSDDILWAKNHFLKIEGVTISYIDPLSIECPEVDLLLMSKCKHQVTANSTFSWWGAYLNSNPQKIVCTPERWYNHHCNGDLIPDSWVLS